MNKINVLHQFTNISFLQAWSKRFETKAQGDELRNLRWQWPPLQDWWWPHWEGCWALHEWICQTHLWWFFRPRRFCLESYNTFCNESSSICMRPKVKYNNWYCLGTSNQSLCNIYICHAWFCLTCYWEMLEDLGFTIGHGHFFKFFISSANAIWLEFCRYAYAA